MGIASLKVIPGYPFFGGGVALAPSPQFCPTHAPASCLDVRGASKAKGAEIYL
jgi:hypothetical protein